MKQSNLKNIAVARPLHRAEEEVSVTGEFVRRDVIECSNCEHRFFPEDSGPTLYECGNCGTQFNQDEGDGAANRCPRCGHFASSYQDYSCPACSQGAESEEVFGYECARCEELFLDEEEANEHWEAHHAC